jgi:hypothetical protein
MTRAIGLCSNRLIDAEQAVLLWIENGGPVRVDHS